MGKKARSVAMEMTRGDLKSARKEGNRTPFEVLADITASVEATGEIPEGDFALWQEWEEASANRRQQVWSRGMRAKLGLDAVEATDEELAAEEIEGIDMLAITSSEWRKFTRDPEAHSTLIRITQEAGSVIEGRIAAAEYLASKGIEFTLRFPDEWSF